MIPKGNPEAGKRRPKRPRTDMISCIPDTSENVNWDILQVSPEEKLYFEVKQPTVSDEEPSKGVWA